MKLQFQEYNISEQHIYQIKYVYEELKKMSLDKLWYDISVDDECVFFYGEKKMLNFSLIFSMMKMKMKHWLM